MIQLDPKQFKGIYPDAPADFTLRMRKLLHELPATKEEKQVKHRSAAMILAIALLLAALSTTAYALTRPAVLDWLLTSRSPASVELECTAQEIRAEATADGVTARITSLVFDGSQIAFSYELENSDPALPVLVLPDSVITMNGEAIPIPHYQQDHDGTLVPSPHFDVLPVHRNPVKRGGWCSKLPEGLSGTVQGEMTFIVYRPEKAFAYLAGPDSMLRDTSIQDASSLAETADVRATLESFSNTIIVEEDAPDAAAWAEQGYTVIDSAPVFIPGDPQSHLVETARIRVPFTFDADNFVAYDFSGMRFELADCTAEVLQFRLTPLTTALHVRLIPAENTREAAKALAERCGTFALTDENDMPVEYSEMDCMYGDWPGAVERDGQWVCDYWEEMPGLLVFPGSIGFTVQTGDLFRFDLTAK